MDAFGYLTVLISIILGLGIAQLLGGFGRCIEHRASLLPYAPALLWAGILLLVHVQTWWSMFGLRVLQQWTFLAFAVVLLQPIVLYLLTILVLPSQSSGTVDIRSNFFQPTPLVLWVVCAVAGGQRAEGCDHFRVTA